MARHEAYLANEAKTLNFGAAVAGLLLPWCRQRMITVFLGGDLGAGKTTFCRGLLQTAGWLGPVRSPTFTLVEPYEVSGLHFYHLDLYRLGDPGELEMLGIRDFLSEKGCCMIEWPQRGQGMLPPPDVIMEITPYRDGRLVVIESAVWNDSDLTGLCGEFVPQ